MTHESAIALAWGGALLFALCVIIWIVWYLGYYVPRQIDLMWREKGFDGEFGPPVGREEAMRRRR